MSTSRAARFERRSAERQWRRQALAGVDPHAGGEARRRCSVPGCLDPGPAVNLGDVRLTLCPAHKLALDQAWGRQSTGPSPAA